MDGWNGERQIGQKLDDIEIKHVERYLFARDYCKDKDVLDAACGCGYGSNILSKEANTVLGVDYSQEAIDYAKKYWIAENISFRQFDLNFDLTPLGRFDVIVSFETIEHLDIPIIKTCQNFYKSLYNGGLLILSHPEKERKSGASTFHKHFDIKGDEVRKMMIDIGFHIENEWYQAGRFDFPYHLIVGRK